MEDKTLDFLSVWKSKLVELRKSGKYCDFKIFTGDTKFDVHKNVLAACSQYFEVMFNSNMIETALNETHLDDVDPKLMDKIIDFCYTAEIELNCDDVIQVLKHAHFLQLYELINVCSEFIIKNMIDIDHCLEILYLASTFQLNDLYQKSLRCCQSHFKLIRKRRDFMKLELDSMKQIISCDKLNSGDEKNVFQSVVDWISFDEDSRSQHLIPLLGHIRFAQIGKDGLASITKLALVRESTEILGLIVDALCLPTAQKPREQEKIIMRMLWASNQNDTVHKFSDVVLMYDAHIDDWTELEELDQQVYHSRIILLGEKLYVVGGDRAKGTNEPLKPHREVENRFYNFTTNSWHQVSSNISHRWKKHHLVSVNDSIYVVGGQTDHQIFMESYDADSDEWHARSGPNDVSIDSIIKAVAFNNQIYVIVDAPNMPACDMFCYYPTKDLWIKKAGWKRQSYVYDFISSTDKLISARYGDKAIHFFYYDFVMNQWSEFLSSFNVDSIIGKPCTGIQLMELGGKFHVAAKDSQGTVIYQIFSTKDKTWKKSCLDWDAFTPGPICH